MWFFHVGLVSQHDKGNSLSTKKLPLSRPTQSLETGAGRYHMGAIDFMERYGEIKDTQKK